MIIKRDSLQESRNMLKRISAAIREEKENEKMPRVDILNCPNCKKDIHVTAKMEGAKYCHFCGADIRDALDSKIAEMLTLADEIDELVREFARKGPSMPLAKCVIDASSIVNNTATER